MNEQALKTIRDFESMPSTPEKDLIKRQYLTDEIGTLEFYSTARRYIDDNSK